MTEKRMNTRRVEDRDTANGWKEYQRLVLDSLKRLEQSIHDAKEEYRTGLRNLEVELKAEMDRRMTSVHVAPCALVETLNAKVADHGTTLEAGKWILIFGGAFVSLLGGAVGWFLHELIK